MSWLRTVLSWVLYQLGRLFGWLCRWDPLVPLAFQPFQTLCRWSVDLDREGRVWHYVNEPDGPYL